MNNNYILARWRDAITDPPPDGWTGIAWLVKSDKKVEASKAALLWYPDPGDQWLDITAIPGVPREAVQAAILEMRGQPPFGCDTWEVALDILQAHCGVEITPSVAEEPSVVQEAPHEQ